MRSIPAAKSGKWWKWGGAGAAFITLMLIFVQVGALGKPLELYDVYRDLAAGLVLAYFCAAAGWLGARSMLISSAIGVLIGLLLMLWFSQGMSGWGDLAGVVSFGMAAGAGVAIGLLLEITIWVITTFRKR